MSALEILEYDHRVIMDACEMANQIVRSMTPSKPCPVKAIKRLTNFFRTFVDDCHCLKEERALFSHLLKHRMALFLGPVSTLTTEHQQGRGLIEHIESLVDSTDPNRADTMGLIADALTSYVQLIEDHFRKEAESLFPMVAQMLSPAQLEALTQDFIHIEQEALHGEPVEVYVRRLRG